MKYEILKEKIVYFTDAIPNHKDIINSLQNTENLLITKWITWGNKYASSVEQSKSSTDHYGTGKVLYRIDYDKNKEYTDTYWIYESIHNAVLEASRIYKEIMSIPDSNPRIESGGYIVGKYDVNTGRGLHSDCPYDDLEHSYVIYLNDDYTGGELDFPELGLMFKPEAGSIVMFKSSDVDNIHQAAPSDNYKYIIPHFWRMGPSQGFVPFETQIDEYFKELESGPIAVETDTLKRYL
ncbi:MAG: 2OG-Fe(II) oxygenase [Minisyncoccia bacterium]